MIKSVASKVMWVGRATVFLVGLAVILAVVFGVASAAFGANGGNFILGQLNKATAVTKLTGNVPDGPALHVNNTNTAAKSRALQLGVANGRPPMTVNAGAGKAINLNADKLDGKDSTAFLPTDTYTRQTSFTARAGLWDSAEARCDEGDLMIGGGYSGTDRFTHVASSTAFISRTGDGSRFWGTWSMLTYNANTSNDTITVRVICVNSTP